MRESEKAREGRTYSAAGSREMLPVNQAIALRRARN